MECLCYSLLGVKWKMCWGIHWATSVGLRRPIAERQRETVRKLSPYDVFPPSQRRFRRDTRIAKRAVFLWEWWKTGGREREREQPTPRKRKRVSERGRLWETLSLLHFICVWHHAKPEGLHRRSWMNMRKLVAPCSINVTKCCIPLIHFCIHDH